MSTVQKTRDTQTTTKTSITTEQSQKLIQTMLTMSFGCVAFLRGLFPDDNFIDQRFVPNKFEPDYDSKDLGSKTDSIRVKTLIKGKSPQVDLFLKWINEGALDAIKKGYLKSLSFAIFLDKAKPHDLQEAYTFFFDYQNDEIKVDINDFSSTISLLNSRKLLQQLMRRFIIITQSLDPLPEQKYMSMRLLFNDKCPKEYQPPLFRDASDESTAIVKTTPTISKYSKYSAGSVTTGRHDVQLNVIASNTSVTDEDEDEKKEIVEIDPFVVPKLPKNIPIGDPKKHKLTTPKTMIPKPEEQSQTTAMLKSFLQSSQDMTGPTQAISKIHCECGSTRDIEGVLPLECSSCGSTLHMYCYGYQKQKSLICFSCRSKALNVPLHENLQLLMDVRKMFRLLMKNQFPNSFSEIHELMGLEQGFGKSKTAAAIIYLLMHNLIIITDEATTKKATDALLRCSNEVLINYPLNFQQGNFELKEGSKVFLTFVPGLKGPSYVTYNSIKTRYRKLLFEDTLTKCFSTDDELNNFKVTRTIDNTDHDDDIVNSSVHSSPNSKRSFEVDDHFSKLKLDGESQDTQDTHDSILMSPFQESGKKREHEDDTTAVEEADTIQNDYYTSQPVISNPRYKKRKTSLSNDVLDSAKKKAK